MSARPPPAPIAAQAGRSVEWFPPPPSAQLLTRNMRQGGFLTVASVAGIPPVLIAGIYGMNFKNMPELNWVWGYPFALFLIVLTTLLPLIWFK
jgi:Mg2+ and Co2+ transporter CorA